VECPFFEPSEDTTADANGEIPTLDLMTREFPTGNDTRNMVRNVRTRAELVDAGTDDPELEFSYSFGGSLSGLAEYDTGLLYDTGIQYATSQEVLGYVQVDCSAPESSGREPHRCRVNKAGRFFSWRIRNPRSSAGCRIRSIDVRVRPSGAVRR
jgi:hypothetical protein